MPLLTILTPCYNEEGNVREVYAQVKAVMETLPGYDYDHLFIDNAFLLVIAIGRFGFPHAMMVAAAVMVVLVMPVVLLFVWPPPSRASTGPAAVDDAPSSSEIRARAFRDVGFLSVSTAFALVLFAQVGFIVHLIAFLDPVIGRSSATVAIAMLTAMNDGLEV